MAPNPRIMTSEPSVLPIPVSTDVNRAAGVMPSANPTARETMTKDMKVSSLTTVISRISRIIPIITISRGMG